MLRWVKREIITSTHRNSYIVENFTWFGDSYFCLYIPCLFREVPTYIGRFLFIYVWMRNFYNFGVGFPNFQRGFLNSCIYYFVFPLFRLYPIIYTLCYLTIILLLWNKLTCTNTIGMITACSNIYGKKRYECFDG